ncbi:MAG: copper-binding protein, partial [Opitutales bacterium]
MPPRSVPVLLPVLGALLTALLLAGCGEKKAAAGVSAAAAPAVPAEIRHALRGEVVAIKPEAKALLIHHEAIPGYMPSMTMEFIVSRGDLENAKVGQRLRGEM